jgi:hypothetical protein
MFYFCLQEQKSTFGEIDQLDNNKNKLVKGIQGFISNLMLIKN